MKALILIAAAACLAFALWRADYSFYNPRKGIAAAGVAETPADEHARQVLEYTVTAADLARLGRQPTFRRFTEFYGATDALGCSIRRTFKTPEPAAATRLLVAGMLVHLCLN